MKFNVQVLRRAFGYDSHFLTGVDCTLPSLLISSGLGHCINFLICPSSSAVIGSRMTRVAPVHSTAGHLNIRIPLGCLKSLLGQAMGRRVVSYITTNKFMVSAEGLKALSSATYEP